MDRRIDRFDKYLHCKDINDWKATNQAGLSVGVFVRARKQGNDLSNRSIRKLLDTYTELNPNWLLNGAGDMIAKRGSRFSEFEMELLKKLGNIEALLKRIAKV